ncbi:toxin Bro, partial [Lentilactobacillus hilgardii]|nr:toxin Bro [Lentilactobacillus hilgardii]MCT3399508.1 toxin Bro [Lentilactobacillus hilgardii]
ENVDRYIRNWVPSTATILIIKQLSEPVASNEG